MIRKKSRSHSHGFGLVELLVSMSIVTIVTSIVIARHNSFNGAVLLRNQAYEIAFVIRQAQQLAVSGQTDPLTAIEQRQRYGVYISPQNGSNQVIVLYKDNAPYTNGYNSAQDELVRTVRLDSRFRIASINGPGAASVVFQRPLFDALVYPDSFIFPIAIEIRPVAGGSAVRTIVVTASGQITVE